MDELKYTQTFIKGYGIFTIIMGIFKFVGVINVLPKFPTLINYTLGGIIGFVGQVIIYLFSLLLYSIPEYPIVNSILWILRILSLLEILLYAKRLIHPTSN